MSVDFTDEKVSGGDSYTPKTSTMVRWILKTGIVKDEKQANIVLLVIAVIFFVITFMVVTSSGSSTPKQKTTYLEDIPANVRANLPPEVLKTIPSRNSQK